LSFRPAGILLAAAFAGGCAGGRIYYCGINHSYLCAVRVARVNGYAIRVQDFKPHGGKMVAARSVPDPQETVITRSLLDRAVEIAENAVEKRKVELGKGTAARLKTEERIIVDFKATGGGLGWLDWGAKDKTMVKVRADVTQYGMSDWIIKRKGREKGFVRSFHEMMDECLKGSVMTSALPAAPPEEPAKAPRAASPQEAEKPAPAPPAPEEAALPKPAFDPEKVLENAMKDYERGDYRAAGEGLEKVLSAEPRNAEALGYLGAAYYQMGRLEDSLAMYERYLEIVPADAATREFADGLRSQIAEGGK